MMEEPTNLDATLYKLVLKPDRHSAVFQIKRLYKTRRLCHSEPEKSETTWWRLKERRVLSRQLHTDLRKKKIEQLLQQLMDFMLLSEMLPKIFEFLPFLNQHLSSWLVTSLLQTWRPRMDYGEAEGEGNRASKIVRWKDFKSSISGWHDCNGCKSKGTHSTEGNADQECRSYKVTLQKEAEDQFQKFKKDENKPDDWKDWLFKLDNGSLGSWIANKGINSLTEAHSEQIPNGHNIQQRSVTATRRIEMHCDFLNSFSDETVGRFLKKYCRWDEDQVQHQKEKLKTFQMWSRG